MTLCIASVCDNHTAIVTVSDTMLTIAPASGKPLHYDATMLKLGRLADTWRLMYAGDNITHLTPVVDQIRRRLAQPKNSAPHPLDVVTYHCEAAYHSHWRHSLDTNILHRFGTSYAGLMLGNDWASQPPDIQTKLYEEVRHYDTELELLIYGFDSKAAHIIVVSSPGKSDNYDTHGFWVLGFSQAQRSVLNHIAANRVTVKDMDEMVVRLCEAKFKVQGKWGIGPTTTVHILFWNNELWLSPSRIVELYAHWLDTKFLGSAFEHAKLIAQHAINEGAWYNDIQKNLRAQADRLIAITAAPPKKVKPKKSPNKPHTK